MKSKIKMKDTALLVVDVINYCCHPDCEIEKPGISFNKIRRIIGIGTKVKPNPYR